MTALRMMVVAAIFSLALVSSVAAETIPVTTSTLAAALKKARPGDTVILADGMYRGGIEFDRSGTSEAPITVKAAGDGAIIVGGKKDGFVVSGSWVIVERLKFRSAGRGGIGILSPPDKPSEHNVVRNCVFSDNDVWGLITSHTNHLLIEGCEAFGSKVQHGIYFSNSGDDVVIRNNRIHDNNMCGLHMNGDPECGGDGVISRALVEGNVIWENGKQGGGAINVTHVQDSLYCNNLAYNNYASGIITYYDTGGEKCASKRNQIYNNTVCFRPGEGRWCLSLKRSSTGDTVKNNVFVGGKYGVIYVEPSSLDGLTIDMNVYATHEGQALIGDTSEPQPQQLAALKAAGLEVDDKGSVSVASWQKRFDQHSKWGEMPKFVDAANGNFRLLAGSVGIDVGADLGKLVPTDIDGTLRPQGKAYDCGCYEAKPSVAAK